MIYGILAVRSNEIGGYCPSNPGWGITIPTILPPMSKRTDPQNVTTVVKNFVDAKGKPVSIKVKSNNNTVDVHSDGACWDNVANKYVLPEDTTCKDPK